MKQRSSGIDQVRESLRRRMQGLIYQPGEAVEELSLPVKVRLMLQELGPTYVKMGQIISSRAEVLPAEWMHELNKLQSNMRPFSSDYCAITASRY